MKFQRFVRALAAALAGWLLAAAGAATAAVPLSPVPGLYNTGIDGADSGTLDDHWTLQVTAGSTSGYSTPTNPYVSTQTTGFPFPPWLPNTDPSSGGSRWVTPRSNTATSLDAFSNGTYDYRLSFDLTGYDPSTATLSGRWSSDNNAAAKLNGTQFSSTGNETFGSWTTFSLGAGSSFVAGLNTFEFVVTNIAQVSGNPTGLRVEFTGSSVTPVPEPHEWAMMLAGLGMVVVIARRRRASLSPVARP
jgi:hypothetical protein